MPEEPPPTGLGVLEAEESQEVLRLLLEARPELRPEAERLARSLLQDVAFATIEPFLGNLRRHLDLGLEVEAMEILEGILLGLYRFEGSCRSDGEAVLEWAADWPGEAVGQVLDTWREGRPGQRKGHGGRAAGRRVGGDVPLPPEFLD